MKKDIKFYRTIEKYYNMVGGGDEDASASASADQTVYKHESMSGPLKLVFQTLKMGAEEIPFAGEIVAVISVIISTAGFFRALTKILQTSSDMTRLVKKMSFKNGLDDCQSLVQTLTDDEITVLCQFVPKLSGDLRSCIADWVSTIPQVGPVMALIVSQKSDYDSVAKMYGKLPDSAKSLFQDPDQLIVSCNQMIEGIRKEMLPDVQPEVQPEVQEEEIQSGSGIMDTITSGISSGINKSVELAHDTLIRVTAPTRYALHLVGLDTLVVGKTLDYINNILSPSVAVSAEALKTIFPLFFIFLLIEDRCKQTQEINYSSKNPAI